MLPFPILKNYFDKLYFQKKNMAKKTENGNATFPGKTAKLKIWATEFHGNGNAKRIALKFLGRSSH